jgi:hypothetical protein
MPLNTMQLQPVKNDKNFHTDLLRFQSNIKNADSKDKRNNLIKEIIEASNMECNAYQYSLLNEKPKENSTTSLYTSLFKSISSYIGLDIAHEAISAISSMQNIPKSQNIQEKYQKALTPNILKAIEISRAKYSKKIQKNMKDDIKKYPIRQALYDLDNYDKHCSAYYGMIEITNALNKQQTTPQSKNQINPQEIKSKITQITKEVTKK